MSTLSFAIGVVLLAGNAFAVGVDFGERRPFPAFKFIFVLIIGFTLIGGYSDHPRGGPPDKVAHYRASVSL